MRIRIYRLRFAGIGVPRIRATPGVSNVAMIQNTVAEIVSPLIRDWRMYWASACMMA